MNAPSSKLQAAMVRSLGVGTQAWAVAVAGVACVLASCGGGGSGSTMPLPGEPPVIQSFAVSPSWVTTGQSATLKWSVSGATSLSVDPVGSVGGTSTQVTPAADTTYVLTATNQFGSTSAQTTVTVFLPPSVWFTPYWGTNLSPPIGSSDYFSLFTASAPWTQAAAHVTVFKIYSPTLDSFPDYSDAAFQNLFADLKRRHIALAMEWGALTSSTCGNGVEGFVGLGLQFAQRIQRLGGTLEYVAFDEPFDNGSLYTGPNACRWSALQVAQNAAQNLAEIRSVFPDVVVGDIEVVPNIESINDWLTRYQQWLDAWQATTGKPFAFFHFDVNWPTGWKPSAAALTRALQLRQIPVGHIYNTIGAHSDASWIAGAESHMDDFETHERLLPDQANFQSWDPYPTHVLPETDPTAFTYLIDRYFRSRTEMTLAVTGGFATGKLIGPPGGAVVQLSVVPVSGTGQLAAYSQSGTLPTSTQSVVFGARVGIENCAQVSLPAEFYLTDFTLDAGTAGSLHMDFSNGLTGWGVWGNPAIAAVEGTQLHLRVLPGQTFGLNSATLPFAHGGATYTFTVHATIPAGSRGSGCAVAVYQDQTPTELSRDSLLIEPQAVSVGSAATASDGSFSVPLAGPLPSAHTLWADYAGTSTFWPAAASLKSGIAPLQVVTPTVLPAAAVGAAYAQTLTASGGVAPYLWVGVGLPQGIVLGQDGSLSGTPTTAGTYTISVSVVGSADPTAVADDALSLTAN
jgi:hypothetical protein